MSAVSHVNDFVLKIATVNGTGSASANGLLMKALFRMGIPVTGKNLFPSNIQGLPTWYEIRANRHGYMSRTGKVDVMVAMNAQTYARDMEEVSPGGFLIYDSTWPRKSLEHREDITVLGVPLAGMCNEHFSASRIRILMKNVAYVGVLSALLDIDPAILRQLLEETFASKPKLIDGNLEAINLGYDYAQKHFTCPLPVRAETMGDNRGHILIDGNSAAALGCVYAGATVGAWYPITPSTSLMDAFEGYCEMFRKDPDTGRNNFCIIQAEDELAAAGIVLGANWTGARAFTPTSGAGISLMSEFIGFAHECFEMAVQAFDLAERLQTPVFFLSDLDIGMNDWMIPELKWDDGFQWDRGKVLGFEELEKIEKFYRYFDADGDGIPYRSYPGTHHKGAYFVRGSGHNRYGAYTEDAAEYQDVVDRLLVKWETARGMVPKPVLRKARQQTTLGIIACGSSDGAVSEAMDQLAGDGIHADYLRIRAFPFADEVKAFIDSHQTIFVVEQNRDAQLRGLLVLETVTDAAKLVSVLHYNGMPIPSDCIADRVRAHIQQEVAA